MFTVDSKEFLYDLNTAVCREAEMAYSALLFLLKQIIEYAEFRVDVVIHISLVNIMDKIEIEIRRAALFKLLLEYLLHLWHI